MTEPSSDNKISNIINTIRSLSLLWDLDELLKEIIKNSVTILNADFGYLLLLESAGLTIKAKWSEPNIIPEDYISEIAEKVIRHGMSIYAQGLNQGNFPNAQIYCVPMTTNRGVLGVIYIQTNEKNNELTDNEKSLFEMLGLQAASFLENAILYHSAITDPLTSLYSHRHFQLESDQLLRRASRTQTPISLMILDLDHFKQLNDQFGHEAGNVCLKKISELLKGKFRATDVIARFGGDEFEILLPDATTEKCIEIAEALNEQIRSQNFPLKITGTIGIASYPNNALDSQSLFLAADQALYLGKQKGRNCITASTITPIKDNNSSGLPSEAPSIKIESTIQKTYSENIKNDIQRIDGLDIINRIASSSNGEVMLAKQYELNRMVALKRPLTANLTDEQSDAFKKEAYITASLSHPGVVPLYTMGRGIDGRLYYTMKPIKGLSLAELLNKWQNKDEQIINEYNLNKLIHILLKASETIAYAHSKNIAHLDVHPGNIIVGEFGEITLIDWGKGINLNENKKEKNSSFLYLSGSPIFRSPEQLTNKTVGTFTDIYSLGIILYEILTDNIPFKGKTQKDTVQAIINGIEYSPEIDLLNVGIDPLLSKACKMAIKADPGSRISAIEFSKMLLRYVMLEADIKIHRFNTPGNPMELKDWSNVSNKISPDYKSEWRLKDGVLSSVTFNSQHMIYWNTPITGNFTFTCEGWITEFSRELSLVCYGLDVNDNKGWGVKEEAFKGYCFQFGADKNVYTKLARHADDILIDSQHTVEKGRKYLLTISYHDGWLHCYIDKKLIFNYREMHPFKGHHLGFYCFGEGSHFRPIEVRYESTGLMVPAIRLADEKLNSKLYVEAIVGYDEIIQAFPDRLEGYESKLKKGICLTKLGKTDEALVVFNSLKDTILEPFAMAEMALMELPLSENEISRKNGDYKKAAAIFNALMQKYPRHQAILRILTPCFYLRNKFSTNSFQYRKNYEESIRAKVELFKLGLNTTSPLGQSQINCFGSIVEHLIALGEWDQAMLLFKELIKSNNNKQLFFSPRNYNFLILICYSTNEWDYYKEELFDYFKVSAYYDSYSIVIHELFYKINLSQNLSHDIFRDYWKGISNRIIIRMIEEKDFEFDQIYKNEYFPNEFFKSIFQNPRYHFDTLPLEMLLASDSRKIDDTLIFVKNHCPDVRENFSENFSLKYYLLAIHNVFEFKFEETFEYVEKLGEFNILYQDFQEKRLVLSCLMFGLGYVGKQTKDELDNLIGIYLAGPRLELASNLMNRKVFELSNKWPKNPMHNYFDLAIYSIWLYEKKEFDLLKNILTKILKPEFGNAFFQPLLKKIRLKI